MSVQPPRLSKLLKHQRFPQLSEAAAKKSLKTLQSEMLSLQQSVWRGRKRAVILFEGFDAAGKGGCIRTITESLDPRGFRVHPIGPPTPHDRGIHYLYRFWRRLPPPGTLCILDRSWYGRVLVERVDGLVSKPRLKDAYREIHQFEKMLLDDGIVLVKIFLAIHPEEQLSRFEDRLKDPTKHWKLQESDLQSHRQWDAYVAAADDAFQQTHSRRAPWTLIPADSKAYAKVEVLKTVTSGLAQFVGARRERREEKSVAKDFRKQLAELRELRPLR